MHTDAWQNVKMHTEQINQHDSKPESRNGNSHIAEKAGNLIQDSVLVFSGIQSQHNGDEKSQKHTGSHQDHSCRKTFQHLCENRAVIHQGISEIPVKNPSQPQKILFIDRFGKSQAFS